MASRQKPSSPKHQTPKHQTPKRQTRPAEPRVSVVVTVGWMLGAFATLSAELAGLALQAVAWSKDSMPEWLRATADVLFIVALVSGLFTLMLTPVCLRVRPTPPPKRITATVLTIAGMPLVVLLAKALTE